MNAVEVIDYRGGGGEGEGEDGVGAIFKVMSLMAVSTEKECGDVALTTAAPLGGDVWNSANTPWDRLLLKIVR